MDEYDSDDELHVPMSWMAEQDPAAMEQIAALGPFGVVAVLERDHREEVALLEGAVQDASWHAEYSTKRMHESDVRVERLLGIVGRVLAVHKNVDGECEHCRVPTPCATQKAVGGAGAPQPPMTARPAPALVFVEPSAA